MEEKSLTSQRLVYDAIHDGNAKLTHFQITLALRKGCLLSHQQYKMELEKKVEEKQGSSTDLRRKMKHDKISNVKKQRVEIEATIQSSTDGIIKEALLADDKKDPLKMKHDKISNVKKQRVEIEATIQSLTDGIIKAALLADDKKDPISTAKAAAFCHALN